MLHHPGPAVPRLTRRLHAFPRTTATELPISAPSTHGGDDDDDEEADDAPPFSNIGNLKLWNRNGNSHSLPSVRYEYDGMNNNNIKYLRLFYEGAEPSGMNVPGLWPIHQPLPPPSRPRNVALASAAGQAQLVLLALMVHME